MPTINKVVCHECGRSINLREIVLFSGMVSALWKIFKWCEINNTNNFNRKEVKHLFKSENETARFGDWLLFGGILTRKDHKKGNFIMDMDLAKKFFVNELEIPLRLLKNPITKVITCMERGTLRDVPKLSVFLDDNLDYVVRYEGYQSKARQETLL
jgi:hypothetical protein